MGGFTAKFRGFWVGYGRGTAIQRTADAVEPPGRKNFLKRGGKLKNWGARGAERWIGGTLDRACGAIFGSRNEVSAVPLEVQ
jgi:hypothetical protein